MAHQTASMARVKNPSQGFGEAIGRIENPRNGFHSESALLTPVLNGEMLNVNMAITFSGLASVDHFDSRCIVFIEDDGANRGISKLGQNTVKIFGYFAGSDGSKKSGFSGTGGSKRLGFASTCNRSASEKKSVASGRATTAAKVIGMSSINISDQLAKGSARKGR
jgi:hypothetical protein